MKALLLTQYKQLELAERPQPRAAADEVLVRVAACGICGSDVHGYDGSSGRRIPPLIMGHEAAGFIAAVGQNVRDLKPGDRVTFDSTVSCGECPFCLRGEVNLCDRREVVGVSCGDFHRDGAFAEYIVVPRRIVYALPDTMPFAEAAMLEAVSVALHAVAVADLRGSETALVIGAGMIGLLTLQAALVAGCSRVFVADIDASRLRLAQSFGASETFHLSGADLARECQRLTEGAGTDVVFEAVGRNETVGSAIGAVRKGGTVTLIGNITPEVTLPLQKVVSRQVRLQGTAASAGEYPRAIELIAAGKVQVRSLISAVASLHEGAQWFERLYAGEQNLMKVVLSPNMELVQ
jgi:L-iditol 2-dehydrogenase